MSGNLANCGVSIYRFSYKIHREIIVSGASLEQGTTWRSSINSNVLQDPKWDPAIKGYSLT